MQYTIKIDKDNPDPGIKTSNNNSITIEDASTGTIIIDDENREFGFYTLYLGPEGIAFGIDIYMKINPELDSDEWGKIVEDTVAGTEATMYSWISAEMQSVKNKIKIEISNSSGAEITLYYVISAYPRSGMPNRKF